MNLSNLRTTTRAKRTKRVGRGGKRGTTSGGGTKGQKGRAGASVRPGFRGGDNRIWQLFPKQRGASKKPGNSRPHRKHRHYQIRYTKGPVVNLDDLNVFQEGQLVTPEVLYERGLAESATEMVKILGNGALTRKLKLQGFAFSVSAKEKISKAGGEIIA